ncbi:MAG TPA: hypothetical protein PK299_00555 [Anaerolineales bacterium]|nr:hypothetical protein [Anaerolineales bacterium]
MAGTAQPGLATVPPDWAATLLTAIFSGHNDSQIVVRRICRIVPVPVIATA